MVVSGVRSSWLASVMNRRIRSSDPRAFSAEDSEDANASWIWVSIPLSASDNWPTSVRGSHCGIRRSSWPPAMAAAVCSTSDSGRRLRWTTAKLAIPAMTSTPTPMPICSQTSERTVCWTSERSIATVVRPCGPRTDTARHSMSEPLTEGRVVGSGPTSLSGGSAGSALRSLMAVNGVPSVPMPRT